MTYDQLIARFLTVWGEPKTDNVADFLAEYARILKGCAPEVLALTKDLVIDNESYWPRPAEVRKHLNAAAARYSASRPLQPKAPEPPLPEATPEQRSRTATLLRETLQMLAAADLPAPKAGLPLPPVDRDSFRAMQANSPNPALHRRPITGDAA